MLKYKSVIIIIITSIIILLGMSVKSIAVDNTCKLSLDIDKKQVKRGDTVTVLIKASDIQGDGIAIFNANLSYDKDTFECTVNGNEEANWVLQGNIENNISIARGDYMPNKTNQTIGKIVLKVKQNATVGNKSISLTKAEFSTGDETFEVADAKGTIAVIEKSNSENNTANPEGNTAGNEVGTQQGEKGKTETNNNEVKIQQSGRISTADGTKADKKIPQTGIKSVFIISAILVTIIVAFILYKRNKYMNIK